MPASSEIAAASTAAHTEHAPLMPKSQGVSPSVDSLARRIPSGKAIPMSVPVGSSSASYDALAAPVGERLFFAGEATNRRYRGTVHGAYESGVRESERIVSSALQS